MTASDSLDAVGELGAAEELDEDGLYDEENGDVATGLFEVDEVLISYRPLSSFHSGSLFFMLASILSMRYFTSAR